jgi:pimeloyl-ACP methyl ester carboxylesterase
MAAVSDIQAWSRLTAAVAEQAILPTVYGMHRVISDGAFRWVGPLGRPVKRLYDRVVADAYEATSLGLRAAGEVGAIVASHVGDDGSQPSALTLKGRAIAHGVLAEELLTDNPTLAVEVTLRVDGREVAVDRASLQAAFPAASSRVFVFVHGLVDSEAVWSSTAPNEASLPALVERAGASPHLVRYGSGRAIGRNGADLAELLEAVTLAWPLPVTRIVLVGHSMGGLVTRAACATAQERGHGWVSALSDVAYLGTPHLGSWLEKATNVGGWVLRRASNRSAPIAGLLEQRSRGIKDLRHGTLVEDGRGVTSIDDLLSGLVPDLHWLEGVTHHLVIGRLRPAAAHPLNIAFGDALVRAGSARGVGRRRRIGQGGPTVVREVEASHTALVRHPAVAGLLGELCEDAAS